LNCSFVCYERLHDKAEQVRPIYILLLDYFLIVIFNQAVDPHRRIVGTKVKYEEGTVTAAAGMHTCEIAS